MNSILAKKAFSANTTNVYLGVIKRLDKLNFKFPKSKPERVDYLKKFYEDNKFEKPSTRLNMLNIVIVLRTIEELPTDKLKEYRDELTKERVQTNIKTLNKLKDNIMSVDEFDESLFKSFENKDHKRFISNYLMRTFGSRSMDIDVMIIKNKSDMTDDKQNYLLIGKKKITWFRNTYKTVKKYGPQKHEIDDPEFVKSVKEYGTGKLFTEKLLSNGIKKVIYNGMVESNIFKMLIAEAYDKKDTAEINRLSKSRGTSVPVIKDFYDLNAKPEIIRNI